VNRRTGEVNIGTVASGRSASKQGSVGVVNLGPPRLRPSA
jgi:hypothetical protein